MKDDDFTITDEELYKVIGPKPKKKNTVESLIGILRSPIADRKGWTFSAEECKLWAEELEKYLNNDR